MATVLLDMDGVCVNFVGPSLALHKASHMEADWPKGVYRLAKRLGMTEEAFWEPVHAAGAAFWEGLEPYPWFEQLYTWLSWRFESVVFCSSPSLCPEAAAGKIKWLKNRFGNKFKDYILTGCKERLCRHDWILLDDDCATVRSVWRGGGRAVCFPQPWNLGDQSTSFNRLLTMCQDGLALNPDFTKLGDGVIWYKELQPEIWKNEGATNGR